MFSSPLAEPVTALRAQLGILESRYLGRDYLTEHSVELLNLHSVDHDELVDFTKQLLALVHGYVSRTRINSGSEMGSPFRDLAASLGKRGATSTRSIPVGSHRGSRASAHSANNSSAPGVDLTEGLLEGLVSARDSIGSDQHDEMHMSHVALKSKDDVGFETVNNLTLLKEIGAGAFGRVMLAEDSIAQEQRAVKLIPRKHAVQRFEKEADAVLNEVAIMKKLRHKNIVRIYECIDDPDEDVIYIVMQYIDSGPIVKISPETLICPPLSLTKITGYFKQMIPALRYMHSHGVIHRDIKPDNILINSAGELFLVDFGVSALQTNLHEQMEKQVGTPFFLAPELVEGKTASPASDLWAVGVTLYVLLFGKVPFRGRTYPETLNLICVSDVVFPPATPDYVKWKALVKALLVKDPTKRLTANQLASHPIFKERDPNAVAERDDGLIDFPAEVAAEEEAPFESTELERDRAFILRQSFCGRHRAQSISKPVAPVTRVATIRYSVSGQLFH